MAIQTRQVATNATSAVPLEIEGQVEAAVTVFVRNDDATNAVYIGGPGVTATTGFKIPISSTVGPFSVGSGDDLYVISAAGTPTVHVITRI